MPNNFRVVPTLSPTYYISKAGNDSQSGAINTPKASINAALPLLFSNNFNASGQFIIGTGVYEESFNYPNMRGNQCLIINDGIVVLKGNGSNNIIFSRGNTQGSLNIFNGLNFENYSSLTSNTNLHIKCRFKDIATLNFGTAGSAFNPIANSCRFINCTAVNITGDYVANCIFINCNVTIGAGTTVYNCYFNSACQLNLSASDVTNYAYNDIMCPIKIGSTIYTVLADAVTAYPNFNSGGFNLAPGFNNSSKLDFTVNANSPLLGTGSGGSNIAAVEYANCAYVIGTNSNIWDINYGAIISQSNGTPDLMISGNDYILAPGKTSGTITSAPRRVAVNPQIIQAVYYYGQLLFNKLQAGGNATNQNVPDVAVYASADASGGGNPDRLVYGMRWTDQDTQPNSPEEWLNANLSGLARTVLKFEINTQPKIDSSNVSSGEPNYSQSTGQPIAATWIQEQYTITNMYL